MNVPARVRLLLVGAPLRWVHGAAHGAETDRRVVLVEWTATDGTVGWGECPTLSSVGYVTETTARAWAALRDLLVPAALGGRRAEALHCPAATAALADAELDAELRRRGVSLRSHLGGSRRSVRWTAVIAAVDATPASVAGRAVDAVRDGASMVKVKIRPGADVEVLTAVIDAIGDVPVAADANGSYRSYDELVLVDRLGLAYLEQPVSHELPWTTLSEVAMTLSTPVALDESLRGPADLEHALATCAADVMSIKPSRMGGVAGAAAAARRAAGAGSEVFVGGMLELGVGRAAALAIASLEECGLPTDVGPTRRYVERDVTVPVVTTPDGTIEVPDGRGVGVEPLAASLELMTIDEVVLGD